MLDDLTLRLDHLGSRSVLVVVGDLDQASTPRLRERLAGIQTPGQEVVLELAGVRFMDSSGLNELMQAKHRAEAMGGRLVLRRPSDRVRHLLELTELRDAFQYE